jgi:hypothetical protein
LFIYLFIIRNRKRAHIMTKQQPLTTFLAKACPAKKSNNPLDYFARYEGGSHAATDGDRLHWVGCCPSKAGPATVVCVDPQTFQPIPEALQYPDIARVIPAYTADDTPTLRIDPNEPVLSGRHQKATRLDALKALAKLACAQRKTVSISADGVLRLETRAETSFNVIVSGLFVTENWKHKTGLNIQYLVDALAGMDGVATLKQQGPLAPIRIDSADQQRGALIMPIKL